MDSLDRFERQFSLWNMYLKQSTLFDLKLASFYVNALKVDLGGVVVAVDIVVDTTALRTSDYFNHSCQAEMIKDISENSSNHFIRWFDRLLAVREAKQLEALLVARRAYPSETREAGNFTNAMRNLVELILRLQNS